MTATPQVGRVERNLAGAHVVMVAPWDWILYRFQRPVLRALRAAGADVTIVCPEGEHVAALLEDGLSYRHWGLRRRSMQPVREAVALRDLAGLYRELRPDLVHQLTIKPIVYGTVAARRAGRIPTLNGFLGLGWVFSEDRRARILRGLLFPVLRRVFGDANVWSAVLNESDRERLLSAGLADEGRLALLPSSGVGPEEFHPAEMVREDRTVRVLLGSRLIHDKGIGVLVEAARRLNREDVEFLVAGVPDPGNPRSMTAAEIEEWRTTSPVTFLGRRDDMPELLRSVDVAVLPTAYPEGVPSFLLEAAATGLPLIATDMPGCREVVVAGETGLLVPVRDPGALADAIVRLVDDPSLRRGLGEAARRRVLERFTVGRVIDAHLELYRRMLAG